MQMIMVFGGGAFGKSGCRAEPRRQAGERGLQRLELRNKSLLAIDRRKHGFARQLYERFFTQALETGCARVKAITTVGNLDSIEFHRALGFHVDLVKDYRGPGEDRVVFTRALGG